MLNTCNDINNGKSFATILNDIIPVSLDDFKLNGDNVERYIAEIIRKWGNIYFFGICEYVNVAL